MNAIDLFAQKNVEFREMRDAHLHLEIALKNLAKFSNLPPEICRARNSISDAAEILKEKCAILFYEKADL